MVNPHAFRGCYGEFDLHARGLADQVIEGSFRQDPGQVGVCEADGSCYAGRSALDSVDLVLCREAPVDY